MGRIEEAAGSIEFTPVHLDVQPLKTFLVELARQVDALQKDNAALRKELEGLKVPCRADVGCKHGRPPAAWASAQALPQRLADWLAPGHAGGHPAGAR